uniref:MAX dimerization protein 4 n=1 Tax=Laticauda laticaudata TaxID=8630 RepID=A0A8C5SUZ9_LATLA
MEWNSLLMLLEAAEYLERREREAEHGYASALPFERACARRRSAARKAPGSRSSHNELEKHRRAKLRLYLEELKQLVPLGAESTRHTTLSLLKRAKMHIKRWTLKAWSSPRPKRTAVEAPARQRTACEAARATAATPGPTDAAPPGSCSLGRPDPLLGAFPLGPSTCPPLPKAALGKRPPPPHPPSGAPWAVDKHGGRNHGFGASPLQIRWRLGLKPLHGLDWIGLGGLS